VRAQAKEAAAVDRTLAALADQSRRGVIDLLRRQPRRAGELAQALGLSPPALSRHLRLLRQGGLIESLGVEEDSRVRVFRLRPEPFAELRGWLEEVASFWGDQLDSLQAHAERRAKEKRR
jgi:DNA-binding transcriptional ArsR family regulator